MRANAHVVTSLAAVILMTFGAAAGADSGVGHVREAGPADAFLCCNGIIPFLFRGDEVLTTTGRAGIFHSDHRGQHWQRSMQGFVAANGVALFADMLCQAPSRASTVYALGGIGRDVTPFNGVLASSDFGSSWVRGGSVDTGFGFNICAVDADDPRTLFVSGFDAAFANRTWRSTDGGQTIEDLASVPSCALGGGLHAVPGALYMSAPFGCAVVSHDHGATFDTVPVPSGLLGGIDVAPGASALFATMIDASFNVTGLFRSTDGGASYVEVSGLPFGASFAFDPTDRARVYASDFELHVSHDGGLTFTRLPASDDPRFFARISELSVDSRGALYINTVGGPFRSDDHGVTFRSVVDDFHAASVVDLGFDAAGRLLVPVQHTKVLYRATQGPAFEAIGTTPAIDVNGFDSDAAAVAASPTDPNVIVLAMTADQGIYRTDNGGDSWTSASVEDNPISYSDARMTFAGPTRVYAVNPRGRTPGLFRSDDAGQTFAHLSTLPLGALAVDPTNANVVYVGTFGDGTGLFKSIDGGVTLQPLGQSGDFGALAVDRGNPQTIYAGERLGQVLRSLDGGHTFAPASAGLSGAGVHAFAQDSRGTLYAWLRGGGLLASDDAAASWHAVDTGEALQRSGVEAGRGSLAVDPKHPGRVYLGNAGVIEIVISGNVGK